MILSLAPVSALAEESAEPDEPAEALREHSYEASETVAPTCEGEGHTVYTCECGGTYTVTDGAAQAVRPDGTD